jgi:eukaryotic-like serine/threonine-protein kinase
MHIPNSKKVGVKLMECPYCKAQNRDGVRYCSNCGRLMPQQTSGTTGVQPTILTAPGLSTRGNSGSIAVGTPLQGGRYVIKSVLGQGGMGAALLASDKRLDNKLVVIKELISESTDSQKLREDELNFKREVVTLAHLDHPLIPNVTDNFDENLRFFMVQEYVEGENLEEHIDRLKQPMKERDVLIHASEILDVLNYLSEQTPPIVHRDIKPANIIISSKDKRAHLVDFGIARADVARNARRKQTSALGTPGYAPPEQYQGNADPRSDLYALGATLYHLLTNRDPRNAPPFSFSPARMLNPQLSPEVERLLKRALENDINQRYQSAQAMKHDVEEILYQRFGISSGALAYSSSGPMGAVTMPGTNTGLSGASTIIGGSVILPPLPNTPQPPGSVSPPPVQQGQPQSHTLRNVALILLVLLILLGLGGYGLFKFLIQSRSGPGVGSNTPTATVTLPSTIGVTKAADGEYIGISDGNFAFDTTGLADASLKQQAAAALKAGNTSQAIDLYNQAVSQQSNDAEALIYLEDQRVLANSSVHVTIVIATMLTGTDTDAIGVGFDDLQGAYVAQKTYNDNALLGGLGVVLLIANAGDQSANAPAVAQQIVRAAKADSTIVGVMGWPYSSYVASTYPIFEAAQLPMISQTASSDELTGVSRYLFRVCPSNKDEAVAGANYASQNLHAQNVIVFTDPLNAYTSSLSADFTAQFQNDGGTVLKTENYTVGEASSVLSAIKDTVKYSTPDTVYFAGYASDLSTLMTYMAQNNFWPHVQIVGGDGFYQLHGYQTSSRPVWFRLHFTAFAYPDVWDVLGLGAKKPAFFANYTQDFDPAHKRPIGDYGWNRTDNDVMLSYDATVTFLTAVHDIGNFQISARGVEQALTQLNGSKAFQGVSGQISLGSDGNPINKAVLFLNISPQGYINMVRGPVAGQFSLS